ncbi:CBS domain-containing protein [Listeria booriae]|uniref:CBS domain-containing protein n=1 Tax=Listeria booriae TaxID=1552123 RepID=A0A7X1CD26_9LIST|nr:cyclic-di-AMP-binding protein CbpB [Listeria booriae]MBC1493067.1 CBS domain-containing protein [Listeria booriae]MBC1524369.1 CBS domain-containing protein [Listeria booriae]MBC1530871.1 CBS domain-containing protein [Listeria booriae]MBC2257589.1 CBS domain-containing protein [Listeria booriae]MBC6135736.1 CBS domain-containing protein [Listeria booriae]
MISSKLGNFLSDKLDSYMISAEKVAHVQMGNNLEHALLVLTKCGYSVIPVLDFEFKLHGLISSAMITDAILGLERIEYERLDQLKVEDVMQTKMPVLTNATDVEKIVKLLVDNPFICVIDEAGIFEGIITRHVILKQVQRYIHE